MDEAIATIAIGIIVSGVSHHLIALRRYAGAGRSILTANDRDCIINHSPAIND